MIHLTDIKASPGTVLISKCIFHACLLGKIYYICTISCNESKEVFKHY